MSYYLPQSLQKRVFRYILLQIGILDTTEVGLDNIDFSLGKESKAELKDVGINIGRLSKFLKLPKELVITNARIGHFRITFPIDIYRSGISIYAENIQLGVKVRSNEENHASTTGKTGSVVEPKRHAHAHSPAQRQPRHARVPGGFDIEPEDEADDDTIEVRLPTSDELAQSFLETESQESRAQLENALGRSQHQDVGYGSGSSALEESMEEDGMGSNLSIPGFLAGFMRGILDRITGQFKHLHLDLHLDLPDTIGNTSKREGSETASEISMRLVIEEIAIAEALQAASLGTDDASPIPDPGSTGSRRISLRKLKGLVMAESESWSPAQTFVSPSPETSHRRLNRRPSERSAQSPSSSQGSSSEMQNLAQSVADLKASMNSDSKSDSSDGIPDFFNQAPSYSAAQQIDFSPQPKTEQDSQPLLSTMFLATSARNAAHYSPRRNPRGSHSAAASSMQVADQSSQSRYAGLPALSSLLHGSESKELPDSGSQRSAHEIYSPQDRLTTLSKQLPSDAEPDLAMSQDLEESQIFSHDQASTMYMSVLSHQESPEFAPDPIPGAWAVFENDADTRQDDTPNFGISNQVAPHVDVRGSPSQKGPSTPKVSTPSAEDQHFASKDSDSHMNLGPSNVESGFATPKAESKGASVAHDSSTPSEQSSYSARVWRKTFEMDEMLIDLPALQAEAISTDSRSTQKADTIKDHPRVSFETTLPRSPDKVLRPRKNAVPNDALFKVRLGAINVVGDVGLVKIGSAIVQALKAISIVQAPSKKADPSEDARQVQLGCEVSVHRLVWKFLDQLSGLAFKDALDYNLEQTPSSPFAHHVTLLKCEASDLKFFFHKSTEKLVSEGSVQKFSFGYADEEILSFDESVKLRNSTGDLLSPNGRDVNFNIVSSKTTLSVGVTTLPLRVKLNLQRLDEALTWFGGLSGLLELSNSIASNLSSLDGKKKSHHPARRGVRFEDSGVRKATTNGIVEQQQKVTARIGGFDLDVIGSTSTTTLSTTAIKAVSRAQGVGVQVDRVNVKGPFRNTDRGSNLHQLTLSNIRLEYHQNPQETDLEQLLALLAQSQKPKDRDDDILVDTLLRQRNKGAVFRATIESAALNVLGITDVALFSVLCEELKKLSTVAKYLPENDRPGLLTLCLVRSFNARMIFNEKFGALVIKGSRFEAADVTFPTLVALSLGDLNVQRESGQEVIGRAPVIAVEGEESLPVISARFIGNEMDPKIVVRFTQLRLEYHVKMLIDLLGVDDGIRMDELVADVADMAASIVTLKGNDKGLQTAAKTADVFRDSSDARDSTTLPLGLEIYVLDSIIGLNPKGSMAKGYFALSNAELAVADISTSSTTGHVKIRKASLLISDNDNDHAQKKMQLDSTAREPIRALEQMGFVAVARISSANVEVRVSQPEGAEASLKVEIRDELFILETCADSTHTLGQLFGGLAPPPPKSDKPKYRTEVVPIENLLASFTGDAMPVADDSVLLSHSSQDDSDDEDFMDDDVPQNLDFVASFYDPDPEETSESVADSMLGDDLDGLAQRQAQREIGDRPVLEDFEDQIEIAPGNPPLDFREEYFGEEERKKKPAALRMRPNPLTVCVRDVHLIWNLYDGYDWQRTRNTINEAAAEIEKEAIERTNRRESKRTSTIEDDVEEDVIGDYLFNSIYIGIPAKSDPRELARQINANIDDTATETGSTVTTPTVRTQSRPLIATRHKHRPLKLSRSKHHKITFELRGVSLDYVVFPSGDSETENSMDLRVRDLEIFDHVSTSTWKKFATYMHDAGERESGASMVHINLQTVRPVASLSATELLLRASVLPLRLHVDQDALDFMSRFFEFKDDTAKTTPSPPSEPPFIQRAEVTAIRVKLDFKPKRVDYAGIRSGRTNEFMNFFVLDNANMVLRRVIVHGVSGFDRLGQTLNDIWMPDVKRNQLPGVLAGLAPVRSLVNVGSGVRDLVAVPIREYRKDGRIVRSFQKGAVAFAKTTTSELMRLGAKLAIGTQTVLQGAEGLLAPQPSRSSPSSPTAHSPTRDDEEDEPRQISLYADQPVGVLQGLRGGYASLERDLLTAKDAIVAMPGEIMESADAGEVVRAVWKGAPTVILRPAMGVTKAVGQTLMGAGNTLDPENRRRVDEKYKKRS